MAEEEQDEASKTEEASYKKLDDALKKGKVINSREVTSFLIILTLTFIIAFIIPIIGKFLLSKLQLLLEHSCDISLDYHSFANIMMYNSTKVLLYISPIFILLIAIILFSHFIQQGTITFSSDPLMPDLARISMSKGLGKIFSMNNLTEFIKNITKLIVIGLILYVVIISDIQEIKMYQELSISSIISQMHDIMDHIMYSTCIALFAVAGIDYAYQRYSYFKSLRMTKQELKDEHKDMEGSPEVKRRQRQLMYNILQQNINASVPKADVIITNPTHYAVALAYNPERDKAPIIVAKGLDLIAIEIKKIAEENDIMIIESPPLARSLYLVNIGSFIPFEHYETVAKIIGYVFSTRAKRKNR